MFLHLVFSLLPPLQHLLPLGQEDPKRPKAQDVVLESTFQELREQYPVPTYEEICLENAKLMHAPASGPFDRGNGTIL